MVLLVQGGVDKFLAANTQPLCQEMPHAPPDADTLLAMQRNQMHAAHRLVCGQELCVIFQVWQPVPGHVTQRQLCPLVTYGGAQNKASFTEQLDTMTTAKMEPVFQFVAGQKYYLSVLIQNRDPTSLHKLPFTDCIEVCPCIHHSIPGESLALFLVSCALYIIAGLIALLLQYEQDVHQRAWFVLRVC